jgi:hypothetical protein
MADTTRARLVAAILVAGLAWGLPRLTAQEVPRPRIRDRGDFRFQYGAVKTPALRRYQELFQEAGNIEDSIRAANESLALPADVGVTLMECGQAGASYDEKARRIELCYELVAEAEELFKDDTDSKDELDSLILGAVEFVFHHELGHALVDVLDLPITGREEDAVDDLATLIYVWADAEEIALLAAQQFFLMGVKEADEVRDVQDLAFWAEHTLSLQRFYAVACLVAGGKPQREAEILETVPELAGRACAAEFKQKDSSWRRLLQPFFKR